MLFLIACEQFLRDIEEDLSYWATIVYIKNADISRLPLDNDKYASIPCVNDYKINLEIFNEKKHKIKEAIDSTSDKDIVVFEKGVVGSDGTNPPKAGVDYTLKQKNQNTLELNLSKTFLERSEWSSQNLSPTITLWNKEGRKFPQTFTFKLRANTPPPALEYKAIGKTKDADASGKRYYVLCFEVKDMDKKINTGELLHKDIAGLSVTAEGGTENSIPLTVNEDGNSFNISNSNGLLLPVASVNKLEAADITTGTPDDIPSGKGIIYFKTDVEVKGAAKTYTFKLFDKKGLSSSEIAVSTSKTQAADAKLYYNSTDISTLAGNSSSPYPTNTELPVTVKAKTETSGATIRGTLFKKESGTWSEVNGIDSGTSNEVDITLSPLHIIGSTIEYKISLTTGGTGFAEGTAKEFYVNVTRSSILTINGDDGDAWSKLKTEVEKPSGGAEIIRINGTIKAKSGDTKIEVKRTVKIMGKKGKTSDILNADNQTFIFDIFPSGELTLEKLTLQNGKNTDSSSGGGAIYCAGGKLTTDDINIENCTATQKNGGGIYAKDTNNISLTNTGIKSCTANENGGAIYAEGATVTMTGCTLTGNKADKQGGAICAEKTGAPSNTPSTVTISGGTIGGTDAADANKATGAYTDGGGGGIYIGEDCTLTMKAPAGSPAQGVQVIGNTAVYNGAGIYTKGNLTMENCTITDNKTTSASTNTGGGGVYVESGIVEIKDATKIYHNYAGESGGGIYVKSGTVKLENATIGGEQFYDGTDLGKTKGNGAQYCGGIHVKNGTITMENCTLSSNTARDVGGIQADNGNLTVKGCTLTNNKAASFGGGIYVTGGTFTMENCTLTGNTTGDEGGGGVYVEGGTFKMKGSSRITPSSGSDEDKPGKNDVFLKNDAKITVDSVLTGTAPVARITVPNNKYLPTTQVLTADSGVTLENETYKFAVTPQTSPTPQEWTVGGNGCLKEGRYTEVPYGQLETYLANASSTEVNYIEVTGISAADLTGSYGSPPDPGVLGQKIKNNSAKKVALKLPSGLSVTDMSACFSQCENLVSLENFPSGVTDMRACFYMCGNLTTVPDIPASVTDMNECFRYCRSLTTALNIPAGVYDMSRCFQYCEKLQSIKMNCHYGVNFNGAFSGCDALPNGGIQVPSTQLGTYKANAGTMGTTPDKFVGF